MFEAKRDFEVDNFPMYELSLFVLGKAPDKHKTLERFNVCIFDDGKEIVKQKCVINPKARYAIKERFNECALRRGINIDGDNWKLSINKVALGVSQKRQGKVMGKKKIDTDICEHDFDTLCKFLQRFSEEQKKLVLAVSHLDEYVKETVNIQDPHAHVVYSKFTKFEKDSLGNFFIDA